jgi:hypothetical protein
LTSSSPDAELCRALARLHNHLLPLAVTQVRLKRFLHHFVNALVLSGGGLLYLGQERLGKPKIL